MIRRKLRLFALALTAAVLAPLSVATAPPHPPPTPAP